VNRNPVYELVFELTVPRDVSERSYRQAAIDESDSYMVSYKTSDSVRPEEPARCLPDRRSAGELGARRARAARCVEDHAPDDLAPALALVLLVLTAFLAFG